MKEDTQKRSTSLSLRYVHKSGYRERAKTQALKWAMGCPYHNLVDDECCPDFSCCVASLFESDAEKRWKLYDELYTQPSPLSA